MRQWEFRKGSPHDPEGFAAHVVGMEEIGKTTSETLVVDYTPDPQTMMMDGVQYQFLVNCSARDELHWGFLARADALTLKEE